LRIDRLIKLASAGVDANCGEQRLHAEGAGFVRDNRDDVFADRLVLQKNAQDGMINEGRRDFLATAPCQNFLESVEGRNIQGGSRDRALGNISPEVFSTLVQILHFRTVVRRLVEWRFIHSIIVDRNAEPIAEAAQLGLIHLLAVVGDVSTFARFAQAVAFDRLGQDHRG